jgi:purine-binding chemotaxis protein CheW
MSTIAESEIKQFIVFRLENEEYGIDIQKVTTIENIKPMTRVPKAPEYFRGVINLRGDIIPIIDLRLKFNLKKTAETEDSRIIFILSEETSFGIIVDKVEEVLQLKWDSIESVANFTNDLSMDYLLGVGKVEDRIVTLLKIEKFANIDDSIEP